ncbi:MAG: DUF3306 domain-containing protein [Marinibacterium sp.]|nr:DUF3306 domain-containing protein [Marinibacterium sp.]
MSDFWSRRKAAVAAEAESDARLQHETALAAAETDKTDAELLDDLGLPDPDTLDDSGAIKAFMQDAVPHRLRRRALRRLWALNPALANLDGLVDYGEDFTDAATVVENLQTAYQVGKGMLHHIEALAAEDPQLAGPPEGDPDAGAADSDPTCSATPEAAPPSAMAAEPIDFAGPVDPDPQPAPPPRRRMRFTFEEQPAT